MRLLDRPSSFVVAAVLGAGFSLTACAVGNVTTDTTGSGGAGAAGGTTASAGGSGGSVGTGGTTGSGGSGNGGAGGSEGPCFGADDCVAFSDACNVGACINGACGKLYTNNGGACEDGKECSQNDTCQYGVCMPGSSKPCTVDNPCAVGVCDVETDTCVETPGNNGAFCNLGDSCILSASCLNGVCQPTQIVNCTNLDGPCSTGYCDPQGGCKAIPKNDGAACNDSLFCTVQDQCVAGSCQGVPNTCAAPGDVCMIGSCNEAAKTCVAVPGNNGASCDDGNPCTAGETCSSGSCLGGAAANDGAACDDKNGCTGGTSCVNGTCANAQSQIVACVDGDMCCPAGCANDKDCLYWVSGVQVDVPAASLTGWTQCFADHYDNFSTPMAQILSQCNQAKLLLACRPVGATSFTTLAMGMRPDVLFDCGSQQGCTQQGNGVGWYYSDSYSWGYAPAGEPVSRNSCDTQSTEQPNRLCWHSGGGAINGGWRCGSATGLNDDPSWERVVYQAN